MTDTKLILPYLTDRVRASDVTMSDVATSDDITDLESAMSDSYYCQYCDGSVMCHAQLLFVGMQSWIARQLVRPLPALLLVTTSSIVWTAVFLMMFILVDFEPVLGLVMASSFAMLLSLVVAVTSMNAQGDD